MFLGLGLQVYNLGRPLTPVLQLLHVYSVVLSKLWSPLDSMLVNSYPKHEFMSGLCRDMTEDDIIVISSNGQLTLTLVSKNHEGEWRCQATNSLGSSEARATLTVTPGKGNTHKDMHTCAHTIKDLKSDQFGICFLANASFPLIQLGGLE